MVKRDICLWPQHVEQAEVKHLFPLGGTVVINNVPVEFIPMNGASGLKPKKGTQGYEYWKNIPYGGEVKVSTLIE